MASWNLLADVHVGHTEDRALPLCYAGMAAPCSRRLASVRTFARQSAGRSSGALYGC
jgi:hypothetical protein